MKKKTIYAVIAVVLISAIMYSQSKAPDEPGRKTLTDKETYSVLETLKNLGYIDYSDYEHANRSDQVRAAEGELNPGFVVFSLVNNGKLYLMNESGDIVHTWRYPGGGSFKDFIIQDDGTLVAIYHTRQLSIIKLGWDSKVIWDKQIRPHHDISIDDEGNIFTLVYGDVIDETAGGKEYEIYDEEIIQLDQKGNILSNYSIYEIFWDTLTEQQKINAVDNLVLPDRDLRDPFHTNTVNVLTSDQSYGKKGDVLLCMRNLNMIASVDLKTKKILWSWGTNTLDKPHDPTPLDNGNILIFDNGYERGYSRILELDPRTKHIVWNYTAENPTDFYSKARGISQKMPNGNVFIVESDRRRMFEVTPKGEIVWEYISQLDKNYGRYPIIFRGYKLSPTFIQNLLDGRTPR